MQEKRVRPLYFETSIAGPVPEPGQEKMNPIMEAAYAVSKVEPL